MSRITEDLFKAFQLLAAKAALSPSWEDWYRRVCRWYSEKYHTPLHIVYTLSDEEVIFTYWEDFFYQLHDKEDEESKQHLENALDQITSTKEERDALQKEEQKVDNEDDDWYKEELDRLSSKSEKDDLLQEDTVKSEGRLPESENPNLIDELPDSIYSEGEDSIIDDAEDD